MLYKNNNLFVFYSTSRCLTFLDETSCTKHCVNSKYKTALSFISCPDLQSSEMLNCKNNTVQKYLRISFNK